MDKDTKNGKDNQGFERDSGYGDNPTDITPQKLVKEKTVPDDSDEVDLSCGIGRFRTNIFGKWFSNLYVFTVVLSISAVCHMMISGVIDIHILSLQRQFNIDASQIAFFDTALRIGFLTTILIPGHFAKRSNIPFMVGFTGVVIGIILTLPALLQFVRPYELPLVHSSGSNDSDSGGNTKYLCRANYSDSNGTDTDDDDDGEPVDQVVYFSLLAIQLVKGAMEPFHSHSLVNIYLDDNTIKKSEMALFLGIQHIIMDLATPAGKALNGIMTKIPIDLKDTEMDPKDQRFVSAWWLGFLAFGLSTAAFSAPIMLFPKRLVSKKQQSEALLEAARVFSGKEEKGEGKASKTKDSKKAKNKDVSKLMDDGMLERRRSSIILSPDMTNDERYNVTNVFEERRPSLLEPDSEKEMPRRLSLGTEVVFTAYPAKKKEKEGDNAPENKEYDVDIDDDDYYDDDDEDEERDPIEKENVKHLLKDFPKAILRLLRNPVFVVILLDIFIVSIPISGIGLFRSLYVNREFNVPMIDVAFAKGIMMSVSSIAGTLVSMYISRRLTSKYGYMWLLLGTYFFTTAVIPLYLYLGCDDYPVYGAQGEIGLPMNTSEFCGCEEEKQLLSCGSDGNIYYSPCLAGCQEVDGQTFSSCNLMVANSTAMTMSPGLCETPCYTEFIVYIAMHGVQALVSTMAMVPRKLLLIRVVDPRDRGFASSLFSFCWIVLAVPSPNIFGRIIESACLIRDGNVCTLFNRETIRYIMGGIDLGVHVVIVFNMITMVVLTKRKDRMEREKREEKAKQRKIKKMEAQRQSEMTTF